MLKIACLIECRDDYGDTLPRDVLERLRGCGGRDAGRPGDRHAATFAGGSGHEVCRLGAYRLQRVTEIVWTDGSGGKIGTMGGGSVPRARSHPDRLRDESGRARE